MLCTRCGAAAVVKRGEQYFCGRCALTRDWEEIIAVVGPALVRCRRDDDLRDVKVPPEKVYRFTFPPGVPHAIQNVSRQPNVLVAFNTVAHDPQRPDTVPVELIGEVE